MNLTIPQYGLQIELIEDESIVVAVENQGAFLSILHDLWQQSNGNAGQIILADKEKLLDYEKKIATVLNPISVSCNEKKILTKLYKEMQKCASESYYEEMQMLNSNIVCFLENLSNKIPYGIMFDLELDMAALLKMYSVSVADEAESFLERLINYFKVMHRIAGYQCYAVLGLRDFLFDEELEKFYEFIEQEHLTLLIFEGTFQKRKSNKEKIWILDKDLCIINNA